MPQYFNITLILDEYTAINIRVILLISLKMIIHVFQVYKPSHSPLPNDEKMVAKISLICFFSDCMVPCCVYQLLIVFASGKLATTFFLSNNILIKSAIKTRDSNDLL